MTIDNWINQIWMSYIGTFVFSNFGVTRVASQRFVFTKKTCLCFCWTILLFFLIFSAQWNLTKIGPNESRKLLLLEGHVENCLFSCNWCLIKNQSHISDFNLSGGCFRTNIIQNCTKWFQIWEFTGFNQQAVMQYPLMFCTRKA